jgi:hypothetical protein
MADANGVSEEIPPVPSLHTKLPGMRWLASVGFVILHVTGGVFAVVTWQQVWSNRTLLQLLVGRMPVLGALPSAWLLIVVCLALVAILAMVEVGRAVWRWRQRQPEQGVILRLRVLLYAVLACLVVNVFILSTPEAFSGPFRVRHPILAEICATFFYGAYVLWLVLLPWLQRAFSVRVRRGLDVLCMNAVLVLVLAEVVLRFVAAFWSSPILVTESSSSQIRREAERQRPGSLRFSFPINQGGHYDTEFVGGPEAPDSLVVSIGDSFSYGMVPHAYHFTTVAEREYPGVEIYNMGYPGIGPSDYLYLLEHVALPLEPDLVVVQLFMGNDVTAGPSLVGPPRWYDADSYLLAIVWYRLRILRRAERTDLAAVTEQANLTREELALQYPWLGDPLRESASLGREVFTELESRNAWAICLPHPGTYEWLFGALASFERVAGDVPLAFVLIPDEFQVEDDLWQEVESGSDEPLDRDLAQRTIVEWLESRGTPVLDLLPILRAVEPLEDGRRHLYHLRDTHFNARGNEVAGRALAGFVESLLFTDLGRPEPADSQVTAVSPPGAASPPVSLPLRLDMGDNAARRWLESGWAGNEGAAGESYVWSEGIQSVLTVRLPRGADIRMGFEALPFAYPDSPQQRVVIILNVTVIGEVSLRPGRQAYSVILPNEALVDGLNTVAFRYAYARSPSEVLPNSVDGRRLGVAWYSIDFAVGGA